MHFIDNKRVYKIRTSTKKLIKKFDFDRSTTVTRLNITRFQPIVGLRLTKKNVHIECFVLRFEGKNLILGILKGYALIFAGLRILFANLRYNSC